MYVRKIFRDTNISNPLIRTRTCAYQGVKNVSLSENFAYVLIGSLVTQMTVYNLITQIITENYILLITEN